MREVLFFAFAIILLGALLVLSCRSKQKRFPTMFTVALLTLSAFYLFQYGNLASFNLRAFSAEASFIRQTKTEVQNDAAATEKMKQQVEDVLDQVKRSRTEIEGTRKRILTVERDLTNYVPTNNPMYLAIETNSFAIHSGTGISFRVVGTNTWLDVAGDGSQLTGLKVPETNGINTRLTVLENSVLRALGR